MQPQAVREEHLNLRPADKNDRYLLAAADQKDGTRDERLARVIHAKFEAGLLKPYDYVSGYRRLMKWMESHVSYCVRFVEGYSLCWSIDVTGFSSKNFADFVRVPSCFPSKLQHPEVGEADQNCIGDRCFVDRPGPRVHRRGIRASPARLRSVTYWTILQTLTW